MSPRMNATSASSVRRTSADSSSSVTPVSPPPGRPVAAAVVASVPIKSSLRVVIVVFLPSARRISAETCCIQ